MSNLLYNWYLFSADNERIRLEVIGNKCEIQGAQALKKDVGIWDFHVASGESASQKTKHFQFYVSINGTYKMQYFGGLLNWPNIKYRIHVMSS